MRLFPTFALLAAALTSMPARAEDSTVPALTRDDVGAWLDGFLPYALERGDIAGAVLAVVKDGEVLLQKGYGSSDVVAGTPVDPARTLFRTGSVGKLFTWTAVMQLVEAHRLDLDRDINEYLDFRIPARDGRPITLRNLMTHTPGFEEIVKSIVAEDPALHPPLDEYVRRWTPERIFPPGEIPAYSNYGVALAGYIVERVSGESFPDYMDHHVFGPLGMTNTTFRQPLPAALAPQMSRGYVVGSGPARPFELVGPSPAGSTSATGADMARFMIAYLQDGRLGTAQILEPATVRQMFSTPLPILPPLNSMLLGFYQQNRNGRRILGHDGDSQYFHTTLNLLPDHGVGVYLAMNSTGRNAAAIAIRTALINEFVDRYFPVPADPRSVDDATAAEHARLLAGTYASSRRAQSSSMSLLSLLSQVTVRRGESGELVIPALTGLNEQPLKWRESEPFVWQASDGKERLAAKVEDGRVTMFSVDSESPFVMLIPVPWWQSSQLLSPLLFAALGVILLTLAAWPLAAVARRRYGVAFDLAGADARAYRRVRLAGLSAIAVLGGWMALISSVSANLAVFSPRLDPWLLLLEVATLVAVAGGTGFAVWNARRSWAGRRGWSSRLWSVVLAAAFAVLLWVAVVFHLVVPKLNY